jgi:hypothetical protein
MPWSTAFDDPIPLPSGRTLKTIADARAYVLKLPKKDQEAPHWQTAADMLLKAAERGWPVMFARIAMLQAIHHGQPEPRQEGVKKRAKKYRIVP